MYFFLDGWEGFRCLFEEGGDFFGSHRYFLLLIILNLSMYEEEHYSSAIKYMLRLYVHGGCCLLSIYNIVSLVLDDPRAQVILSL